MNGKTFKYLSVSVFLSSVAAALSLKISFLFPLIIFLFIWIIFLFFPSRGVFSHIHASVLLFLVSAVFIQAVFIKRDFNLNLRFETETISEIEGRVVYDSSFSSTGRHKMKIRLTSCKTARGDCADASGLVIVIGESKAILSTGLRVRLKGRFSGSMFICDSVRVTKRSAVNDFREKLIKSLEKRMLGNETDKPSLLSVMLLLGRADEGELEIKEKALSCGCAHVLALSGMHLGIMVSLCGFIFGGKLLSKFMSYVLACAFVFTAGPRPSLIRAALAFAFSFMGSEEKTIAVFLVQTLFFPETFCEIGCCYGYAAVFAIVYLKPYLDAVFFQTIGHFSDIVSTTAAVLVFTVPIQLLSEGIWHPQVLVASSAAGFLAGISMALGLLILLLGRLPYLLFLNRCIFDLINRLFDSLKDFPSASWPSYCLFLLIILAFAEFNFLRRKLLLRRLHPDVKKESPPVLNV